MQMNYIGINFVEFGEESRRRAPRVESSPTVESGLKHIEIYLGISIDPLHVLVLLMFSTSPEHPRLITICDEFSMLLEHDVLSPGSTSHVYLSISHRQIHQPFMMTGSLTHIIIYAPSFHSQHPNA